ncbi:MAG: hypothetical protein ACKVHP_16035, partial [Verrucomicrobiales bacterium]
RTYTVVHLIATRLRTKKDTLDLDSRRSPASKVSRNTKTTCAGQGGSSRSRISRAVAAVSTSDFQ